MKLYDAVWAPSPRRVRLFLAEKGLSLETVAIDLRADKQLEADYLAVNPRGTVPALQLDNGEVIAESVAICRYLEALHPTPPLFGATPLEIAMIETWIRRIESDGYGAAVYALRNTRPGFAGRALPGKWPPVKQIPELAERAAIMWGAFIAALDARLDKTPFVAGEAFSFADITALVTVDFAGAAKLATPEDCVNVRRWHGLVSARPSAGV